MLNKDLKVKDINKLVEFDSMLELVLEQPLGQPSTLAEMNKYMEIVSTSNRLRFLQSQLKERIKTLSESLTDTLYQTLAGSD
ncbi:MAG: hypothetical protein LWX54_03110 [Deltaproteobacteria bacterium]|nr:hypothetical protein [Deltaproteobacteria bacterium]